MNVPEKVTPEQYLAGRETLDPEKCRPWHEVHVIGPQGLRVATADNGAGEMMILIRRPDEPWPAVALKTLKGVGALGDGDELPDPAHSSYNIRCGEIADPGGERERFFRVADALEQRVEGPQLDDPRLADISRQFREAGVIPVSVDLMRQIVAVLRSIGHKPPAGGPP